MHQVHPIFYVPVGVFHKFGVFFDNVNIDLLVKKRTFLAIFFTPLLSDFFQGINLYYLQNSIKLTNKSWKYE